uniref:flagellar biosynthesis protein FlhF n=1 Tax=Desulfococcus sp. TaxID=2025834 RepID=UPI003592ED56
VPPPPPPAPPVPPAPKFPEFYRHLIDQDVNEQIAREIVDAIGDMANGAHPLPDRLSQGLTRILREKGVRSLSLEPESGKQRLVAFLGQAGVGKTTTIAKLSGYHSIRGRDIGIIALEDDRICALRKIEIYAKIINVPMEVAEGSDGMQRALRRFRNKEIVYVDTPGVSIGDPSAIGALRKKLGEFPDIRNQLLISAGAREKDIAALVRGFSGIPIHGLIVTRLDESTTYGNLLNHLYRAPMPLSYVTSGQQVPEDIRPASPQMLADLFAGTENAGTGQAPPSDAPSDAPSGAAPEGSPAAPAEEAKPNPPKNREDHDDSFEGLRYYGGRI